MVRNAPTETEKSIVAELMQQARLLVPGTKVRFVRQEQELGEKGLLIGIQLPAELTSNSSLVFKLHDLFEAQSRKRNLSLGLSVSQQAGTTGLLDLGFLPSDLMASPAPMSAANTTKAIIPTLAVTAAAIVILGLVAFMSQKQNVVQEALINNQQTQQLNNHQTQLLKPNNQPTLADRGAKSGKTGAKYADYAIPQSTTAQQDLSQQSPFAGGTAESPSSLTPLNNNVQSLPGYSLPTATESQRLPLAPSFNSTPWTPPLSPFTSEPSPPEDTAVPQSLLQPNESAARQHTLDELNNYSSLLRSQGRSAEAEQVQRIMRELP